MTRDALLEAAALMLRMECFADVGTFLIDAFRKDDSKPLDLDDAETLFHDSIVTICSHGDAISVRVDTLPLKTLGEARDLAAVCGIVGRRVIPGVRDDEAFLKAVTGLTEAAAEIVEGVNAVDEKDLLALDADPEPPSTLNVHADNLEVSLREVRKFLIAK